MGAAAAVRGNRFFVACIPSHLDRFRVNSYGLQNQMGEVKIAGVKVCTRGRGTVNCVHITPTQQVSYHDAVLFERALGSTSEMIFLTTYTKRS